MTWKTIIALALLVPVTALVLFLGAAIGIVVVELHPEILESVAEPQPPAIEWYTAPDQSLIDRVFDGFSRRRSDWIVETNNRREFLIRHVDNARNGWFPEGGKVPPLPGLPGAVGQGPPAPEVRP